MKKLIITLMALILSTSAMAVGSSRGGIISHVASVNDSILFRVIGNSEEGRPACATSGRFSVHKDSAHAPLVMTAFVTGKKLAHVKGLGTCNQWGNSEDLRWIEICPLSGC